MTQLEITTDHLKVFISYSRAQVGFADELELFLSDKGHSVLIDRHSIEKGEVFQDRLGEMILGCDTVVFILSTEFASSKICAWEVAEAARLAKRMLVVTLGRLSNGIEPPLALAEIDWVHCWKNPAVPGSNQIRGFIELDKALRTDVQWLRKRTKLQEQATEWMNRASHDRGAALMSSMLLRGNVLQEAIEWSNAKPRNEQIPDPIERFLQASETREAQLKAEADAHLRDREAVLERAKTAVVEREQAQIEREVALKRLSRRSAIGVGVAGTLATGAAGLFYWANDAEKRFQAQRQRTERAAAEALENEILKKAATTDISGQIAAYAASPGEQALDGVPGGNSPYTKAVLEALSDRDRSLLSGLLEAHELIRSSSSQRPYISTNVDADIYLQRLPLSWKCRALCISNSHVFGQKNQLENTRNDAEAWGEFLEGCG